MPAARRCAAAVDRQNRRRGFEGRPEVVVRHELPTLVAVLDRPRRQNAAEPLPLAAAGGKGTGQRECGATVLQRECHAVDHSPLERDQGGRQEQPEPFAGGRQIAGAQAPGAAIGTPGDQVLAPVGTMLPVAGMPLQHQRPWRVVRIEMDPGEEPVAGRHRQGLARRLEEMLVRAAAQRRAVAAAGRWRAPWRQ